MTTFAELHARLSASPDHERFTGAPIDLAGLTPQELGALWPLLQAACLDPDTPPPIQQQARSVLQQAEERGLLPWLDSAGLLATLQAVPAERTPLSWLLAQVRYLTGDPAPALEAAMEARLPPQERWLGERHALLAIARALGAARTLARLADIVAQGFGDTLPAREFAVLAGAGTPALFAFAVADRAHYDPRSVATGEQEDPAAALAGDPGYARFARAALEEAARLVDRIHAGELPYRADAACGPKEAVVLGRAARVAATRDEPWYPDLIGRLLPGACVAPGSARTAPSQALSIALGHAVEGVPTPEAVLALRAALKVVRHAGLQKKLARNLKPAERALVRRPEVALRLLDAEVAVDAKQQRALLVQFFESGFVRPFDLPYAQWRARLLANPVAAAFARTLVWSAGAAFMLDGEDRPVDAAGRPLDLAGDARVTLWHPVDADDGEREAWRTRIVAAKLRQPLRQVFREFYQPTDAGVFAGYELAALRLGGVARREGWLLERDDLARQFGALRAVFVLDQRIYPGLDTVVGSRALLFYRGAEAVPLHAVPPRILSEACRAVDLLVSVATVALETDEDPNSPERCRRVFLLAAQDGIDAMRRRVVEQVLRPQIAAGAVALEGFHVRAGGARVSIRTGRVLRDGAPVELDAPAPGKRLGAVPWLPYDEALLERVIHGVGALLEAAPER